MIKVLKIFSVIMWVLTFGLIYGSLEGYLYAGECFISGRVLEGIITVAITFLCSVMSLFTFFIACTSWVYNNKNKNNKILNTKGIRIKKHYTDERKEVVKEREDDK